jgi:hypothetical protein
MTDHYATLGVSRAATQTQIKDAYRKHAKTAHPDAGGSVEAMAQVNEAYKTLGDPAARRAYDGISEPEPRHESAQTHHPGSHHPTTTPHPAEEPEDAESINRGRTAWARNSAWEMARLSTPVAIGSIAVAQFIISHTTVPSVRQAAALLAFIPVYGLVLSLVFLFSPPLRLVFADLARRHRTTRHDRTSALGLVFAVFPLAALWVLLFLD